MSRENPIASRLIPGDRFGRLKIVGPYVVRRSKSGVREFYYPCDCDCGNKKDAEAWRLLKGRVRSCGCIPLEMVRRRHFKHGETSTRLHRIWMSMNDRCSRPFSQSYADYGGRGIRVCDEWLEFLPFRDWARANGYADNLTIERIDVNGHYEPANCSWVTIEDQQKNRRTTHRVTAFGETKCLADWQRDPRCSVTYATIGKRIKFGWEPEKAITTPAGRRPSKLSADDVPLVISLRNEGLSQSAIARKLGVSQPTIHAVLAGERQYAEQSDGRTSNPINT